LNASFSIRDNLDPHCIEKSLISPQILGVFVGEVSELRSATAGIQTLSEEVFCSEIANYFDITPSPFDLRIISDFLEIFAEFRRIPVFPSVVGQSRWFPNFTADVTVT
jgi:hypothetical protein